MWLNLPTRAMRAETSDKDEMFLARTALRTWRYFAEFSTEEHHWPIPDNVQVEPAVVAGRMSPTNLGFLLNARQVACEFGFLTVPEFAEQTLRTLGTMAQLQMSHGHLLNWYDTRTLEPLRPRFVSAVDSGNLVASLWTLRQGCLDLLQRPLLEQRWRTDWRTIFVFWSRGTHFPPSASGHLKNRFKRRAGCSDCWRRRKKDCWRPIWKPAVPK